MNAPIAVNTEPTIRHKQQAKKTVKRGTDGVSRKLNRMQQK